MTVTVTPTQARDWIQVPSSVLSDEQLQILLDGEADNQARVCFIDPDVVQAGLNEALLRRVARAAAAKGVPLGMVGDGEYGPARISISDAELERIESPYRLVVFG
jgi:hypothetical protein